MRENRQGCHSENSSQFLSLNGSKSANSFSCQLVVPGGEFLTVKFPIRTLLLCFLAVVCFAQEKDKGKSEKDTLKPAQSIDELRQQLEKVLKDTRTPGMAIAIVRRNGLPASAQPMWPATALRLPTRAFASVQPPRRLPPFRS